MDGGQHGRVRADVAHDKLWRWATGARSARPGGRWRRCAGRGWRASAGASPMGARARPVVPVGLRDGPLVGGAATLVVLRVAGVVPVPGGAADPRQVVADGDRLPRHDVAPVRGLPDLRVDRQREDGDRRARRPDRDPQPGHGRRGGPLRPDGGECLPADAPSKGGSEATVRVAKADLVPTDANLLAAMRSGRRWRRPARRSAWRSTHAQHG